jgi:hypothetical protein
MKYTERNVRGEHNLSTVMDTSPGLPKTSFSNSKNNDYDMPYPLCIYHSFNSCDVLIYYN